MTIDVLRRQTIFAIASGLLGPNVAALNPDAECSPDHREWVSSCLKRLLTIQPGMKRAQLLQVFTTEGGIVFSALQQTFVSRDCPFFKAEVSALTGTSRAIVSPIAGTTRDAVDETVEYEGSTLRFVDTAGIRRKGKTNLMAEKLSVVMARRHLEAADLTVHGA